MYLERPFLIKKLIWELSHLSSKILKSDISEVLAHRIRSFHICVSSTSILSAFLRILS
jgi:hypothetical protein